MEFQSHCLCLGLQVEILWYAGATEPGLCILCYTPNPKIVLRFAALGPFYIELVKEHFNLPCCCRESPFAILVIWVLARISRGFQCINSVIIWVQVNSHWAVTSIARCCSGSGSSCGGCCCSGGS